MRSKRTENGFRDPFEIVDCIQVIVPRGKKDKRTRIVEQKVTITEKLIVQVGTINVLIREIVKEVVQST